MLVYYEQTSFNDVIFDQTYESIIIITIIVQRNNVFECRPQIHWLGQRTTNTNVKTWKTKSGAKRQMSAIRTTLFRKFLFHSGSLRAIQCTSIYQLVMFDWPRIITKLQSCVCNFFSAYSWACAQKLSIFQTCSHPQRRFLPGANDI